MKKSSLASKITNSMVASWRCPKPVCLTVDPIKSHQGGFTIIETTIALLLLMIVALGSASLFSFSIYHNSGGLDRAASLAIAQQNLETLRTAQFTPTVTATTLNGGTVTQNVVAGGRQFTLTKTVDDDPTTTNVDVIPTSSFKRITISVTSTSIGQGWASGAGGTVTLITERTMSE